MAHKEKEGHTRQKKSECKLKNKGGEWTKNKSEEEKYRKYVRNYIITKRKEKKADN